jgi:asparagine synthase (glutamine-hydrolysing)
MCGIFGGNPRLLADDCEQRLLHRGPDQQGRQVLQDRRAEPFVMGMTRLSIIDLTRIPVPYEAGGAWITYNGEVYNWKEIRVELEQQGVQFRTHTDTEVVLQAYLRWGPQCLERFNGMFALAIWRDGEVFVARDRFGKKPLFLYTDPDGLAFASEIKAFRRLEFREVDVCERLEFYFDEHAPFDGVTSLRPGEYALYDTATRQLTRTRWWHLPAYTGSITDLGEALDEFIPLFQDACRLRLRSDVPVTLFLSGGVDSSLIQATVKLDTTYTVQFQEFAQTIDEESLVKEYATHLGFEARVIHPSRKDFDDAFPRLARFIESPVGSFSVFPLYCLAQRARQDGFVVALSGEGADEFFNGYFRNELLLREEAAVAEYLTGDYAHLARRYFGSSLERFCRMASRNGFADLEALTGVFGPAWREELPLGHNLAVAEGAVFMQPLLVMADRMSMAHSLEVRNPFLDYRVVEFSTRLAPSLRYRNGRGKYLLREALRRLAGSDELGVVRRKVKHGLPSPVNAWLLRKNNFDRRDWNRMLLGECLRQLSLPA